MSAVSFIVPVHEELQAVEAIMREQAKGYHPDLNAALELLISAGGKRIRPVMTILVGKMLEGPQEVLLMMAAAVEVLHTATLVHDDLIDGALLRRGMPTLNASWTPGATVLTGDFMFSRAAKLAAETNSVPVIKLFANTLTIIVDGEITQLLGSRCKADREAYMKRIYAKTASLFETSALSAALISEAGDEVAETMARFGYEVGMAFQIIDDILDFTGEQSTIGKPVGGDLRQGIVTLPALLYAEMNPSDPDADFLQRGECLDDERLTRLIGSIRASQAIQKSHAEAVEHVERGLAYLRTLPSRAERYALEELANYIIERRF